MKVFFQTVLLFFTCFTPVMAGSNPELEQAIRASQLAETLAAYEQTPLLDRQQTLTPLAHANWPLAQWLLADTLAQSDPEQATHWLYRASLGTRMDVAVCRLREAKSIEYLLLEAFKHRMAPLRSNDQWRTKAIQDAVLYHSKHTAASAHTPWACEMAALMAQTNGKRIRRNWVDPADQWERKRREAMEAYKIESRLDFSKAPDLIPIENPYR